MMDVLQDKSAEAAEYLTSVIKNIKITFDDGSHEAIRGIFIK
jgi:hypothetical protein